MKKGQCYRNAFDYALKIPEKSPKIVHAICTGLGEIKGMEFGHAWIEFESDGVMMAYDPFYKYLFSSSLFRSVGKARSIREYSIDEALKEMDKSGHYGPWDPVIAKAVHCP